MIKIPTKKTRLGTRLKLLVLFSLFSLFYLRTSAQVTVNATIGSSGTNYTTLSAAFTAINAGTHKGVITVLITNNTTEPASTVALLRSSGTSSYTSITIRPSGGNYTINSAATPTANRGVIELSGADNVTIDGDDPLVSGTRNLSIVAATSTNTGVTAVRLSSASTAGTDGANNVTVRNCIITGSRNSATSTTVNYGINMSNYSTSSMTTGAYSSTNTVLDNNLPGVTMVFLLMDFLLVFQLLVCK